jgi:lactococcin 972 family bacteriocin
MSGPPLGRARSPDAARRRQEPTASALVGAVYTAPGTETPPAALIGPNGEKPTEWGVAAVPANSSKGMVSPLASKNVGGGTWVYGTRNGGLDGTTCYSNYVHPSKKHSATAIKAGHEDKDTKNAAVWAKAAVTAGAAYTCYTYWGVY